VKHRAPKTSGTIRHATKIALDCVRRAATATPPPRQFFHQAVTASRQAVTASRQAVRGIPRDAAQPDARTATTVALGVVAAVTLVSTVPALSAAAAGDPAPAAAGMSATAGTGADRPVDQAGAERAQAVLGRVSRDRDRPTWVHPMPTGDLTSCYGQRWGALHAGVDFAAPAGTPVRAVGAGRVVSAGWSYPGYGMSVVISHGGGYLTHYAHLSAVSVRTGQSVTPGRQVGREGSTGDSTGPHLHFEVHRGLWNRVEPTAWLRARGLKINC